ncbi:MAG: calcium-binding protein, partial [Moorea sp. SIO4G2]|nr:calcium-binding protein [Moorena sp. SIO4G2]
FFKAYGIDDSQIEEIFGRFDQNNDGYIDKQEILDLVTEFYYSQDPEAPGNWIFGSY